MTYEEAMVKLNEAHNNWVEEFGPEDAKDFLANFMLNYFDQLEAHGPEEALNWLIKNL